jgi:prepilin-type N-terminal cleavage/methylation domain-containing protein
MSPSAHTGRPHHAQHKHTAAFTLIELSIVLVIIGLIVGGIVAGQQLIYAARIRRVGVELQQFQTAVTTFRLKYDCLPGDCANATAFWGVDSNGCPTGGGTTGVCNGNGDGTINGWWLNGTIESQYAWKQLTLSGLVAGSYPGTSIASVTPGVNVPSSSYNPSIGYNLFSIPPTGLGGSLGPLPHSVVLIQIGESPPGGSDFLNGAGFTAPDAQALDTKFDDGIHSSGQIWGTNPDNAGSANSNTQCLTAAPFASAGYSTSNATGCEMFFILKGS